MRARTVHLKVAGSLLLLVGVFAAARFRMSENPPSVRPSLRFVCCSDTHGMHNNIGKLTLPEGDVLLFAGDAGLEDAHEVERFEAWLHGLPHKHKVVVMGNMDRAAAHPSGSSEASGGNASGLGSSCMALQNGLVVCDKVVEVAGYRILGSPWTPAFYGQWQLKGEEAAQRHWAKLLPPDADVDIVVTHGPPHGYGDQSRGRHVGDKALLQAVSKMKKPPLLWVCGHIHESFGEHRVPHPASADGILLINAAVNNLNRGDAGAAPRAVDLPAGVVHGPAEQAHRHLQQQGAGGIWKAVTEYFDL